MKMRYFLAMLLVLAGWCAGATYYVNPAAANDNGDGQSASATTDGSGHCAEQTIVAGLADCTGDGDILRLVAGNYSAHNIIVLSTTKSITVISDTTPVTLVTGSNYGGVYISQDYDGKTLTLTNVNLSMANIHPDGSSRRFVYWANDTYGNVVINNCTFVQAASDEHAVNGMAHRIVENTTATAKLKRSLILNDCTYTAEAAGGGSYRLVDPIVLTGFSKFEINGGTYTFTGTTGQSIYVTATDTCPTQTIKNATITSAQTLILNYTAAASAAYTSHFYMYNCDWTCSANLALCPANCETVVIDDCDMTFTYNTSGGRIVYPKAYVKDMVISNNRISTKGTFLSSSGASYDVKNILFKDNIFTLTAFSDTADYAVLIGDVPMFAIAIENNTFQSTVTTGTAQFIPLNIGATTAAYTNTLYALRITGNRIINDLTGYGAGASLLYNVKGAIIKGNYISGFQHGITGGSENNLIVNNFISASNPLFLNGCRWTTVANNTCVAVAGSVDAEGRAIVFGRKNISAWSSSNTTFATTTVTDSSAWTLTAVQPGMFCIIYSANNNDSPAPTHWGIVVSGASNIVTVDKWRKVSDLSIANPANGQYAIVTVWATECTVLDNIFDARLAKYGMNFDFCPEEGRHYIDYNCYQKGGLASGTFGNLGVYVNGGEVLQSLTEQKAKWLTYSITHPYNDAHSIEANPSLDSNYQARNTQLKGKGSPLLIKSDGTVLLRNDIGATKFADSSSGVLFGGSSIFGN